MGDRLPDEGLDRCARGLPALLRSIPRTGFRPGNQTLDRNIPQIGCAIKHFLLRKPACYRADRAGRTERCRPSVEVDEALSYGPVPAPCLGLCQAVIGPLDEIVAGLRPLL